MSGVDRARPILRLVRAAFTVVAVLTVAFLPACGDDDGGSEPAETTSASGGSSTTPSAAEEALAELSGGCDADAAPEGGQTDEELEFGGQTRTYRQMVPSTAEAGDPLPLVLNIHGLGSNADEQNIYTGMEDLGESEGFVVLTPQGTGAQAFWNFLTPDPTVGDIGFISSLVEATANDLCIDLARVFSTGMSNGGLMSTALACRLPDQFAAVSGVAGLAYFDDCDTSHPVAVQEIHGTEDDVLPYEGGLGDVFDGSAINPGYFPPVDESMADWAALEGCDPEPEEEALSEEVTRLEWPNCAEGVAVVHYRVEGGGHTWPGTPLLDENVDEGVTDRLGLTTDDIDASELAWEFFQAHPKPVG